MLDAEYTVTRVCFVNCGMPGDQCACYRAALAAILHDLGVTQEPLGVEFEAIWDANVEELYQS